MRLRVLRGGLTAGSSCSSALGRNLSANRDAAVRWFAVHAHADNQSGLPQVFFDSPRDRASGHTNKLRKGRCSCRKAWAPTREIRHLIIPLKSEDLQLATRTVGRVLGKHCTSLLLLSLRLATLAARVKPTVRCVRF